MADYESHETDLPWKLIGHHDAGKMKVLILSTSNRADHSESTNWCGSRHGKFDASRLTPHIQVIFRFPVIALKRGTIPFWVILSDRCLCNSTMSGPTTPKTTRTLECDSRL